MRTIISRSLRALPVVALGLAAACSTEQSPECVEYVECAQVLDLLTQTDTSGGWSQYDEGGSCWGADPLTAHACTTGCVAAMQGAPAILDEVPVQCGGDFELPPLTATKTLGAAGGTLAVLGLTLDVPAGALAADVEITVENTAGFEEWNDATSYSHVYRFEPEGLTFASPLAVTFQIPPFAREDGASVYWTLPGDDSTFEELGGTLEGEGVTALVTHFSRGFAGRPGGQAPVDGGPSPDGGTDRDAGPPADSGVGEPDAGLPPVDSGAVDPDGGALDGGAGPGEDAGEEAGQSEIDAGDVGTDAGASGAPFITSVDPDVIAAGSGDTVITITGGNFEPTGWAVIDIDIALETTWISPESATAVIPAGYLTAERSTSIGWFNFDPFERATERSLSIYDGGTPDGGTTDAGAADAGSFDGGEPDDGGPIVHGIEPAEVRVGTGDLLFAIEAEDASLHDDLNQLQVWVTNGASSGMAQPLYYDGTHLWGWIYPSLLASEGDAVVTVRNPGGLASAALQLRVVGADVGNPLPTVSGATNTLTRAGVSEAERTLVLGGTGFVTGANVMFKYWDTHSPVERVTVSSATQLEVVLTPRQVAAAGTFPVAVQNPPPGGGASPGFTTWVSIGGSNPPPVVTSVEPNQVAAGRDTTVYLYGTGFLPDFSVVHYGENASIGRCVVNPGASDVCQIVVPAGIATTAGTTISLFVRNDAPGGGSSASVQVDVVAP